MTADEDFVLDREGRLVVGGGCSGQAFKFGPLLGDMLADLALGQDTGIARSASRCPGPRWPQRPRSERDPGLLPADGQPGTITATGVC